MTRPDGTTIGEGAKDALQARPFDGSVFFGSCSADFAYEDEVAGKQELLRRFVSD